MGSNVCDINKIIEEIDNKTTKKLLDGYSDGSISIPNIVPLNNKTSTISNDKKKLDNTIVSLQNIMTEGAADFEKKTGRRMTYSEMRQAFG